MIEMGLVVAIGLLILFAKLSWRAKLWMTSHPVAMDVMVFILLTVLHWGTYSGVMVATVGALFCSITLSLARRVIGYVNKNGVYVRGFADVHDKLRASKQ